LTAITEKADEEDEAEEDDEDEDDSDSDEDDDEDDETVISDASYEVVKVQEQDEILTVKGDDGNVKMWVGQGVDVDFDEVKKGVTVKVSAQQDDEGDWIITELDVAKARRTATKADRKKSSKKK
jgi:hypothetical protein